MSYQGQTWVDEEALPHLKNGGELLVMLRVANHAGNGPTKMSGCYTSAKTLAKECLMGRSTVLNHLRNLAQRGLLVPGDPDLVAKLPPDKRPPVYDLGGAHEAGCFGGHTYTDECQTAGAQIEHPVKKPRSAGAQIQHPEGAGAQIQTERVLKSSTKSSKELKEFSPPPDAPSQADPSASAEDGERDAATQKSTEGPDDTAALQVLASYERAIGGKALNGTRAQLLQDAEALLAARPLWWVIDRAAELPKFGKSLSRHAEMSRVPFARAERKPQTGVCLRHPGFPENDCSRCFLEERERAERPRTDGPAAIDGASLLASLLGPSNA
ncbi:helix-turn-helix domain-containing protein [Streptomyces sp. NPDC055105]|uniref:helix-turn-helix domain-containing protein n=1 Tax=Streptomyces sp. NPDC055105 TaxID=3365719 RepID=UPI0037D31243